MVTCTKLQKSMSKHKNEKCQQFLTFFENILRLSCCFMRLFLQIISANNTRGHRDISFC